MAEIDSLLIPLPKRVKAFNFDRIKRDFISGSIAGIVIVLSGHPFDTVKVRMQMLGGGFVKTAVNIIKEEGIMALYKGAASPLYSSPLVTAVGFASYELGNRLQGVKPGEKATLSVALLSGAWSGILFAPTITPIDLIKCRQQLEGVGKHLKGQKVFDVARSIVKENGMPGLFKGLTATWMRDIPGLAAQFAAYEEAKKMLNTYCGKSHYWSFVAGGIATVFAWITIYPQDTIKTKIQCSRAPIGIIECTKDIYRKGGLLGFWKGLSPCLMRAAATGTTRYLTYEKCQRYIGGRKSHY